MPSPNIVLSLAIAVAGIACGLTPAAGPVPVEGPTADLTALAGEWSGRYWSEPQARHGIITFKLRGDADTARGEVEMTFAPALRLYGESAAGEEETRRPCTHIDITVVRVRGATIRGTLAPYWDPDCDCRTWAVFEGELAGDRVSGTFSSRRESSAYPPMTGRWLVERRHRTAAK